MVTEEYLLILNCMWPAFYSYCNETILVHADTLCNYAHKQAIASFSYTS